MTLGEHSATTKTFNIPNVDLYQFISFNVGQDIHYNDTRFQIISFFSDTRRKYFTGVINVSGKNGIIFAVDLTVKNQLTLTINQQIQYANVFGIGQFTLFKKKTY